MSRGALCIVIFRAQERDQEAVARLIGNAGLMRSTGVQRRFKRKSAWARCHYELAI
jgi:hypothetical protein